MSVLSFASIALKRVQALKCLLYNNPIKSSIKPFSSVVTKTVHDVNTNVAKDVVLFKYENPKFYMYMNVFAIVQYMFWTYLGIFALKTLRDAPVDKSKITEDTPWFRRINLGENKYRNTLGTVAILIGIFYLVNISIVV